MTEKLSADREYLQIRRAMISRRRREQLLRFAVVVLGVAAVWIGALMSGSHAP